VVARRFNFHRHAFAFSPAGFSFLPAPTVWCVVEAGEIQCSAKGCRAPATWALRWNNPKLHTADYRKTWLACEGHRGHLSSFLELRGFLREVAPFGAAPEAPIS
jgi:hypothetical protein